MSDSSLPMEWRARQAARAVESIEHHLQSAPKATIRAGYRRCVEYDAVDGTGQDDAALRCDREYVVGVVADGVSQSFRGDLAARWVTSWLLEQLWRQREEPPEQGRLAAALEQHARDLEDKLADVEINRSLDAYMQRALDLNRRKGSQAVLGAFVLRISDGRLDVFLLGDIRGMVLSDGGVQRVAAADPKGRWAVPSRGALTLTHYRLEGVRTVWLASDGVKEEFFARLEAEGLVTQQGVANSELEAEMERWAADDDVSFIALDRAATSEHSPPTAPLWRRGVLVLVFTAGCLVGGGGGFLLALLVFVAGFSSGFSPESAPTIGVRCSSGAVGMMVHDENGARFQYCGESFEYSGTVQITLPPTHR